MSTPSLPSGLFRGNVQCEQCGGDMPFEGEHWEGASYGGQVEQGDSIDWLDGGCKCQRTDEDVQRALEAMNDGYGE